MTLLQNKAIRFRPQAPSTTAIGIVQRVPIADPMVYFNCLNIKCTMNPLTLAISSNGSYVIPMLNVCIQIVLSPSCLSKNLYHQCTIILFQGVLTLQLMCHDGAT